MKGCKTRARANRIALFDLGEDGQGIVHVMAPELGIVLPGTTLICGDSHTCTNGAVGALAFGVGSSEADARLGHANAAATQAAQHALRFEGACGPYVGPKDLILHAIAGWAPRRGLATPWSTPVPPCAR